MQPAQLSPPSRPELYLLLGATHCRSNLGQLIRTAVAFGATEVLVAGGLRLLAPREAGDASADPDAAAPPAVPTRRKRPAFGAHGADHHIQVRDFDNVRAAVAWLRAKNVRLLGLELAPTAVSVLDVPWGEWMGPADAPCGGLALFPGAEGAGLHPNHAKECDHLVYIPQYGSGTASLNVCVAVGIGLHYLSSRLGLPEAAREGEKFIVAPPPRTSKRGPTTALDLEKHAARAAKRMGGEDAPEGL